MKKACIVLPTYNERENVKLLLPRLFEVDSRIDTHELHVLVVDDYSPDGTADEVRAMMRTYPNLHMIQGEKTGLGEAYKRGMAAALDRLDPDLIIQMDADLQHDPEVLPLMVALHSHGFTLVIGSRFVQGGSTPNFSFRRRMLSTVGNWMLRNLGGLPAIRDCTSGYRCIKADLIRKCDLSALSTKGYSFQSSLLFELVRNGANLVEIPITFVDRVIGRSKLSMADQFEFLLNIFRIRFRKSGEFFQFLLVGLSGVFVNLGVYWLLTRLAGMRLEVVSPIAIELSILSNFFLNDLYTFRKRETVNSRLRRLVYFHGAAGIAGVTNYLVLLLLVHGIDMMDMVANMIGILAGTFINYSLNSKITWKTMRENGSLAMDGKGSADVRDKGE